MPARKGYGQVTFQEEESEGTREAREDRGLEEEKRKKKSNKDWRQVRRR